MYRRLNTQRVLLLGICACDFALGYGGDQLFVLVNS